MSVTEAAALLDYLAANGVEIRYAPTGAIGLPNGRTAFVWERNGKIVVSHPPHGGLPETTYQRFKTRERALQAIRAWTR